MSTLISSPLASDLTSTLPIEQLFQKHLVDGQNFFFNDFLKDPNSEYELRHDLAKALSISINDTVIVGSAKLGFSVKTEEFKSFDFDFRKSADPKDKSDIDIAVVNRRLFERISEEIFHLSRHFDKDWISENWRVNRYNKQPSNIFCKYILYLAKGWLRPDLMPSLRLAQAEWQGVCNAWYKKLGSRKISVGLYSDWSYLKHYQMDNLEMLRMKFTGLEVLNG